jgi:adenylate kinase
MRVRLTITKQNGGGDTPETLISERVIQTESQKQLTAKRAAQILLREHPELGIATRAVIKTPRGWMASRSTEPLKKCGYHYVWRHYYVAEADEQK